MTTIIFLAIFLAGFLAGVFTLVIVAIHREERGDRLPVRAPTLITAAARLVTGLRVRDIPAAEPTCPERPRTRSWPAREALSDPGRDAIRRDRDLSA